MRLIHRKKYLMKTNSILTVLSLIIVTFTLSSCKTTNSGGGLHTMGVKPGCMMSNDAMPGMR